MSEIELPNTDGVQAYVHCGLCVHEINDGCLPPGWSPAMYAALNVGWTVQGLQVWCARHGKNVLHVHFEGAKHPGNSSRHLTEEWEEGGNPIGPTRFLSRLEGEHELWLCWRRGRWVAFIEGQQVAERLPSPIEGEPPTTWVDTNWPAWVSEEGAHVH